MDCVKPRPGVKCHGQERVRLCGEAGGSIWGWLAARVQVKLLWKDLPLPLQGSWPVQHRAPLAHAGIGDWSPLQNCQFLFACLVFSFLLWTGISPWQMILCPNWPEVTPSCEISRAVLVGAEPRAKACILISYGHSSLMKWMVVVGHLTLAVFLQFLSVRGDKKPSCSSGHGSCRCELGWRMPNCHLWWGFVEIFFFFAGYLPRNESKNTK